MAPVIRALQCLATGLDAPCSLIRVGDNAGVWYAAEMKISEKETLVCDLQNASHKLSAAIVGKETLQYTPAPAVGYKDEKVDTLPYFLLAIAVLQEIDGTFNDLVNDMITMLSVVNAANASDMDDASKDKLYDICDMLYQRLERSNDLIGLSAGNPEFLRKSTVESGVYRDGIKLCGIAPVLKLENASSKHRTQITTFGEAKELFKDYAESLQWTDEEEVLIPKFPDDFPILKESVMFAQFFVQTRNMRNPMVNFMWRGITSYGKTTGVEMIAALLHTPLLKMTCDSTMETRNFLSDFVPDNSPVPVQPTTMPTVEQMYLNPCGSYEQLTGTWDDNATAEMCLSAYTAVMIAAANVGTARFKHVESNFVKAMSRGYICEIQECSRIKDPGVLVGLNEYDRPGAVIPLVDGSYTRRHKNAICMYTDNVGYASCRPLDNAVIRRFSFIEDSYEMSKADVLKRVKYNTRFDDNDLLNKMYDVWKAVDDYCKKNEITEGSVSMTELERWVQCVQVSLTLSEGLENELYENCVKAVVAKATSNIDEQNDIRRAILDIRLK